MFMLLQCSGESARFPQMWPGFDSRTRRHMWVEFVVDFCPCSEDFSLGSPVFLPFRFGIRHVWQMYFLGSNAIKVLSGAFLAHKLNVKCGYRGHVSFI